MKPEDLLFGDLWEQVVDVRVRAVDDVVLSRNGANSGRPAKESREATLLKVLVMLASSALFSWSSFSCRNGLYVLCPECLFGWRSFRR